MLELDCAYVREHSLLGDVRLILRTLPVIARAQPPC
jgi:lipopolysaccharide/colanic/teichoic acid biosynthesis glycosyltransferase